MCSLYPEENIDYALTETKQNPIYHRAEKQWPKYSKKYTGQPKRQYAGNTWRAFLL